MKSILHTCTTPRRHTNRHIYTQREREGAKKEKGKRRDLRANLDYFVYCLVHNPSSPM